MDLYYEIHGTGKPIVLLHSGGADLRDWKFLVPLLAKKYKVVTWDGRGAGKSPSPIEPPNYVNDLLELFDHLEIDKATLVGHSIGGQIATEFALLYPDRFSELVLISPSLSGFPYSDEFVSYMQQIQDAAPDMDKMIELALSAPLYSITMAGPHRNLLIQMLEHHIQKTSEWGTFDSIWPQPRAIEKLGELVIKTLFIIGEVESLDNKRVEDCFREVPDIRFDHIIGADHMVTLTHPNELYRLISRFMEE
ncbi:alpha/beta fold hydrolase [Shimazuella kribbensis]|uniref:alpha/beta fold hydrolase n=1 Tax=Shimazuella kribbensis TaxID=139808 RepID=UPI00040412BA|nr:alpha/beta hydrolase [Shimazuella kribbensis]